MRNRALVPVFLAAALFAAGPLQAQQVVVHGVDSLRVRANLQTQLNTTSIDDEASSEWLVRRARVGVAAWAAGWISGVVEADFGRGRAALTDGYVQLDFAPAARIQVGHFKKPFDAFDMKSSRELLVVERSGAPRGSEGFTTNSLLRGLRYTDRDVGGTWSGAFGPSRLTAGVFNGTAQNTIESDDGKQLVARLVVDAPDGWSLEGAWAGNRISEPPAADTTEVPDAAWFHAFEAAVEYGEYLEPGWKALLQAFFADNYDPDRQGGEDANLITVHGIVAYHVAVHDRPYLIGIEPVGRVDWVDPNTDAEQDLESVVWTGGLNFYHNRSLKTQLGIDHHQILEETAADEESSTALRIQSVLSF